MCKASRMKGSVIMYILKDFCLFVQPRMSNTICALPPQATSSPLIQSCILMCFCLIFGALKTRCRFRLTTCQRSVAEPCRSLTMYATTTMARCSMAHSLTRGEQNSLNSSPDTCYAAVHVSVFILLRILTIVTHA